MPQTALINIIQSLFLWFFTRKMLQSPAHNPNPKLAWHIAASTVKINKPTNYCPKPNYILPNESLINSYINLQTKTSHKPRKTKHTFWHATIKCKTAIELSLTHSLSSVCKASNVSSCPPCLQERSRYSLILSALRSVWFLRNSVGAPLSIFLFFPFLLFRRNCFPSYQTEL